LPDSTLLFGGQELARLKEAFHRGAAEASDALGRWLAVAAMISIEEVDQCQLADAPQLLGEADSVVCMCSMEMQGTLTGRMLLAFDDLSGLVMADLLLSQPAGTATKWGEVERSAAQETMNIVGSAYLNGVSRGLSGPSRERVELIPTPPVFMQDFAESLLESAFVDQAEMGSRIVSARAKLELQGVPVRWTFLLIPDPKSLIRLAEILRQPS
jgi:chemotaxis protein CheC